MGLILLFIMFLVLVATLVVGGIRMSKGQDIYGHRR